MKCVTRQVSICAACAIARAHQEEMHAFSVKMYVMCMMVLALHVLLCRCAVMDSEERSSAAAGQGVSLSVFAQGHRY